LEKKNQQTVEVNSQDHQLTHGVTLLQGLLDAGVEISHSCGGNGTCGTCRVEVLSDPNQLKPRNDIEAEMAEDRGFERSERLACQLQVACDFKIKIPSAVPTR